MKKFTFIVMVSLLMTYSLITLTLMSCSNEFEVCRVSFDSQGGSPVAAVDVAKGLKVGEPKSPIRDGYEFAGWYRESECINEWNFISSVVHSQITLYAKWIADSYLVIYHANGATDGSVPSPQSKIHGVDLDLALNTGGLGRSGYWFDGWNTQPDGSGINYATGSIYSTDSSLILYASWVINNYLVTYDANEASAGTVPSPQLKVYGIDLSLSSNSGGLIRNGYTFRGWNTQPAGSGIEYLPGSLYAIDSSVVLYAHWIPQYTVAFDEQGGTNLSLTDKTVTPGQEYGLLATVEKTGYAFSGWWTEMNGAGNKVTETTIVSITSNQTLYASWVPEFTVEFDAQGGINLNPPSKIVIAGSAYGELASTIKLGCTLNGWYTEPGGAGNHITPTDIVSIDTDHTLYAAWQVSTQTITFDPQGGMDPNPISKIVTYGQTYGELATATRDGYTFAGWWTGVGGTGTQVTDSEVFTKTTDQTLYAKWIFDVFTGPAGGLVFYENPNWETDGWRYLEAAPYGWYDGATDSDGAYSGDDDPEFQWGADYYEVDPPATATAIGFGASNTVNIVNYHDTLWTLYPEKGDYYANPTDYNEYNDGTVAAKICADYELVNVGVTFSDWFLPSKDEIYLMYKYLKEQNLGSFSEYDYWSSSEYAWSQSFYDGHQHHRSRNAMVRVRPVRAF